MKRFIPGKIISWLILLLFPISVYAGTGWSGISTGDLNDVDGLTTPGDEYFLEYDSNTEKYVPTARLEGEDISLDTTNFNGTLSPTEDTIQKAFDVVDDAMAANAPKDATYITQTVNATLTAEQALGALATGILKSTTTTGVVSIATASDLPIADAGTIITATEVETALQENRTAIDLNTAKVTESTSVTTPITLSGVSVGIVNQGTTTQVLHGNAAGNAAFGAIVDNDVPDNITIDLATTVTTNANLTGPITSAGNATSIAAQTGTGSTFVVNTSPTLVTPEIGVATGTSLDVGASTLSSRALTVDTGGVFNVALSAAAGDDFTVDTNKLVVEGDTGNVGIGTTTPDVNLDIEGTTGISIGKDVAGGTTNEEGIIKLWSDGDNAFYTQIKTGTQTQNNVFTLPLNDGDAGQTIVTDGAGVLSFSAAGSGDITAVGDGATGDVFTADGTGNNLYFEGATADAFETILTAEDTTTADKTITLPNATGTVVLKDSTDTLTNKTLTAANNVIEADTGDSATDFFSTGEIADARISDTLTSSTCTGNAATVTNATLTTALTVDTGTVGLTGNGANTSVLTLGAGASSVSGANTGDNTVATSGDSATAFFSAGTIEHEYGGLEADVSAYSGLAKITGGATTELKVNWSDTVAPANATDDITLGYIVGSRWLDTTADKEYVCLDNTDTAAVWTETTQSGGAGDMLYSDTRFKVANFTIDTATASGTQAVTGVGFAPKGLIFFMATQNSVDFMSTGLGTTDERSIYFDGINFERSTSKCIYYSSGANYYLGDVASLDADGFTINWVRGGSPTVILDIQYMAIR